MTQIRSASPADDHTDMDREQLARTWAPTLRLEQGAAGYISPDDRRKMAKTGVAMSDGSFPIPDEAHLKSAIRLARTPAQRQHVVKRAKALGLANLLPADWPEAKGG